MQELLHISRKGLRSALLALFSLITITSSMATIYEYKATTNKGKVFDFAELKGKVILVVNTASKCGFTPQYKELEELYKKHKDKGLVIVGFPCDQFGGQEPGTNEEIAEFCQLNYGVTFPIMEKVEVNGSNAHPIFKYLKKEAGGWVTDGIKWNFTKFLISRDGKVVDRYAPVTKPSAIEKDILKLLEE